jgi:hypothetical protein
MMSWVPAASAAANANNERRRLEARERSRGIDSAALRSTSLPWRRPAVAILDNLDGVTAKQYCRGPSNSRCFGLRSGKCVSLLRGPALLGPKQSLNPDVGYHGSDSLPTSNPRPGQKTIRRSTWRHSVELLSSDYGWQRLTLKIYITFLDCLTASTFTGAACNNSL